MRESKSERERERERERDAKLKLTTISPCIGKVTNVFLQRESKTQEKICMNKTKNTNRNDTETLEVKAIL